MTIVRILKEEKESSYLILKRLIETEISRHFFVFANDFFTETFVQFTETEKSSERDFESIMKVAEWYTKFLEFSDVNLVLLTNSKRSYQEAKKRKVQAMTVVEFV